MAHTRKLSRLGTQKEITDEVAVMLDTRDSLEMSDAAMKVENPDYVYSWQEK